MTVIRQLFQYAGDTCSCRSIDTLFTVLFAVIPQSSGDVAAASVIRRNVAKLVVALRGGARQPAWRSA